MDDGAAYASSPSPTRAAREPFRADGVEEHFLDGRASTTTSMVEALSRSLSVVVLANVATVAEHGDRHRARPAAQDPYPCSRRVPHAAGKHIRGAKWCLASAVPV